MGAPSPFHVDLYLPRGIPFTSGCLNDAFGDALKSSPRSLYAVVTREISDDVRTAEYTELCDCSTADRKLLLSPVCDSTEIGLTQVASLLGYFNRQGDGGENVLRALAHLTGFAPLICALHRINERKAACGFHITAVTACLHSLVCGHFGLSADRAFEGVLAFCGYLLKSFEGRLDDPVTVTDFEVDAARTGTDSIAKYLSEKTELKSLYLLKCFEGRLDDPVTVTDFEVHAARTSTDSLAKYLSEKTELKSLYVCDLGPSFQRWELDRPANVESVLADPGSFRPVAPLELRTATTLKLVKTEGDFTALYLPDAKPGSENAAVDLIDPRGGHKSRQSVEKLAEAAKTGEVADMLRPDAVTQLISVCFDESGSMRRDLDGQVFDGDGLHRVTIAAQYLTTFANRIYAYRVPCIQGLITFQSAITKRSEMLPLVPEFEAGIRKVVPAGWTKLWDCLAQAADDLEALNRAEGSAVAKFPKAKLRILVISDGEDRHSKSAPHDVATRLIRAGIVVDSVVINNRDTCLRLCALCHLTGGLSFRPATVSAGLALFEKEAFLFYEKRTPQARYTGPVSPSVLHDLTRQARFSLLLSKSTKDHFIRISAASAHLLETRFAAKL
jgi:hypothetical protein